MNTLIWNFPKPSLVSKFKGPQSKDWRQALRTDFLPLILCRFLFKIIYCPRLWLFFWEMEWEGWGRYSNVVWGPRVDCGSGKNKHVTCVGRKRCLWKEPWSIQEVGFTVGAHPFQISILGRKRKSVTKDIISVRINGKNNHFRHKQKSMGKVGAWIFPTQDHRLL